MVWMPSIDVLHEWFAYDPETGELRRKLKMRSNSPDVLNPENISVYFLGARICISHICYALHHGYWPVEVVDHIDHNRSNNKIVNLREATYSQNQQNRINYFDKRKGVTYSPQLSKPNPWRARIKVNKQEIHIGYFKTEEEASTAYELAAKKYFGEFACLE